MRFGGILRRRGLYMSTIEGYNPLYLMSFIMSFIMCFLIFASP
jgi:hypothetical protein